MKLAGFLTRCSEETSHHGVLSGQSLGSTIFGSTLNALVKWRTGRALKTNSEENEAAAAGT